MKITGLNTGEVDELVTAFDVLMRQEMRKACRMAADDVDAQLAAVTADGGLSSAIDAISVIPAQWAKAVAATLLPFLSKVFAKSAKRVATPLGDVTPATMTNYLDDMENVITSFSSDMWDAAKASLIAGAQDGESIKELATRVENVAKVKAKKAHVIAQTTVIAAVNGGEWRQMMESAAALDLVMTKEWVSTHDSHTRPTHEAADGQTVPLNEKFAVGGSLLDFPGDPYGDPSEIISCRCTTVYDAEIDDEITASTTSPGALSNATAATVLEPETALVAAFNEKDHPRGKDGKFIKSGAVGDFVKWTLSGKYKAHDYTPEEQEVFMKEVASLKPSDWHNFKTEQKDKIIKGVEDAVDEGVPGSAKASLHLEDIDNSDEDEVDAPDIFAPSTPIPSGFSAKKDVEDEIYAAYDVGEINETDQDELLKILDNAGVATATQALEDKKAAKHTADTATNAVLNAPTPAPAPTPLTTGSSTPIKITHGLIHAKHDIGTIIAQTTNSQGQKVTVQWDGSEYEVQTQGVMGVQPLKKSKLYAYLNSTYPNAKWVKPGKQETEVSHASPLSAAPPANPVPHPVAVPSPPTPSPFKILDDTGENGDGYAAPGLWGKFGSAGVLIKNVDENGVERFLMVQRGPMVTSNKGKWQLAGGALNSKETPEQGAAREIFEEIGAPQDYLSTMQHKGTHKVGVPIPGKEDWVYSNIAAEAPTMFTPKIDGTETGDAKWLTKAEIQKLVDDGKMHPAVVKALPSTFALFDTSENNESGSSNVNEDADTAPSYAPTSIGHIQKKDQLELFKQLVNPNEGLGISSSDSPEKIYEAMASIVAKNKAKKSKYGPDLSVADLVTIADFWKAQLVDIAAPNQHKFQKKLNGYIPSTAHSASEVIPSEPQSPSTPSVAQKVDLTGWKKVGGQTGSNKGALYEDATGKQFYVKSLKSEDHVKSEVLAAALYKAAGIDVPEVRHGENHPEGWKNVIISPIVPNAKSSKSKLVTNGSFGQEVQSGYAVDAWLANHDVVGLSYDNIVEADGKPWRIDMGGSLEYRAQGDKKPGWGPDPTAELNGLKNSSVNSQSAKVFGGMSVDQERESAKKLLPLTDDKIDQMVKDAGMPSSLGDTLKARRKAIIAKYGLDDQNNDTSNAPDVTPATPNEPDTSTVDHGPVYDTLPPEFKQMLENGVPASSFMGEDVLNAGDELTEEQWNALDDFEKDLIFNAIEQKTMASDSPLLDKLKDWDAAAATSAPTPTPTASSIDIKNLNTTEVQALFDPNITYPVGQKTVIAKGASPNFPSAEYAYVVNESGTTDFVYKTPGLPWKSMGPHGPKNAEKIGIKWDGTPGQVLSDDVTAPAVTPAATPLPTIYSVSKVMEIGASTPKDTKIATGVDDDGDTWDIYSLGSSGLAKISHNGDTPMTISKSNLHIKSADFNIVWKPVDDASGGTSTPVSVATTPLVTAADVPNSTKWAFYGHFKAEKVSPAWSGAKIYKSMHVAKQKMSGDPKIAALSDAEMLKILDYAHTTSKPGLPLNDSPYGDKVKEWLKTPNGQKAFKDLNPAITTSPSYGYTPYTPPVKKAVKKGVGAAFAKKTAAAASKKSTAEILAHAPLGATGNASDTVKLYDAVKASITGNSVKSPPVELFQNLHAVAGLHGVTVSDVINAMDIETAKKYPSVSHTYKGTISDWLNTPTGSKKANEIINGTYVAPAKKAAPAMSYGGGSSGSSTVSGQKYPASLPLDQKIKNLSQKIEPFDPAKKYDPAKKHSGPPDNDFPVIDATKGAALWKKWQSEQGNITEVQKSALKSYTGSAFDAMNSYLRGYKGATAATHKKVNDAQAGMKLSTEPMVFHRGNGWFAGWTNVAEIKQKVGTDFTQEAFFSSSVGGKSAFSGPINFIIEAPTGTPMAYVKGFSNYGSENEMLIGANITYKVLAVHEHDIDNSWHYGTQVTVVLRAMPHEDVMV